MDNRQLQQTPRRGRTWVCAALPLVLGLEACTLSILDGLDSPQMDTDGVNGPGDMDDSRFDGSVGGGGDGDGINGNRDADVPPNEDGGVPDAGGDAGPPPGTLFFTSFEDGDPLPTWESTVEVDAQGKARSQGMDEPMLTVVGTGPEAAWNARVNAGFSGLKALRYEGAVTGSGPGYAYNKVFDVDVEVIESSELSYLIFPDVALEPKDPHFLAHPSTYAAVDLAFDDGTYLSDLLVRDQHLARFTPEDQGRSRTLYSGEWNYKAVKIGQVAAGKTIKRILVGYHHPDGPVRAFGGFIDDIRIRPRDLSAPARVSDYVVTTRGTNSGPDYSRGNCVPAVAVPHGFNLWTPVTNSSEMGWLYTYHRDNNEQNLPTIEAFRASHIPSPWMGDRGVFQVMPFPEGVTPSRDRAKRALPFRHENEIARPYYYSVTFENGIRVEMTPTEHAAMFRFTFPTREATLFFDHVAGQGGQITLLPLDQALVAQGPSASPTAREAGATTAYIRAEFDKPIGTARLSTEHAYYKFDLPEDDYTVTMKIAISYFGRDQAKHNLDLEISNVDTFEDVRERAQRRWDDKLGLIRVEGANRDQLTTLYSNLYRLFLYPSAHFENVGAVTAPQYRYVSPFHPEVSNGMNDKFTGGTIVDGQLYVNHGFWDTYRATWPLLTLLTPQETGKIIDGFVQHYRDNGWISRWSAPGAADLMTGTSSDIAFADALVKGITGFDARDAYEAALKNATVVPPSSAVGRKGIATSMFRGYTDTDTPEGFSWSMAGYLNDFGIANMAEKLAASASGAQKQQYLDEAEYFRSRALNYVHLFDAETGFFQGRTPEGGFRLSPKDYDPEVWGHDYTETNGWNMAFEPTYDGRGLANLYGGRDKLAEKLDSFFATPETASEANAGSYGSVIHEMREARDVRMGQLGLSNQASFHIIYMYLFAGQPAKAQKLVRDALARLWVGSEIGQGYLGDDDNGSLSAWYIFSALGIYPLNVGTPIYVIGSPLFKKATIRLENGKSIVINASNNSPENVYVRGLRVNGAPYTKTYLTHEQLLNGITLDFDMGPEPSNWGTGANDAPPSLTTTDAVPKTLGDVARSASCQSQDGERVEAFFDDDSRTQATLEGSNLHVACTFASATRVTFYTLTSGANADDSDPQTFRLEGSNNGTTWIVLDQRSSQAFPWRRQTRPFKVSSPGNYTRYRIVFPDASAVSLAEVELLATQ